MLQDFIQSIQLWRYWLLRSAISYKLRYQRASLGLFWPMISLMLVVCVLGAVWGQILSKEDRMHYYLYLVVGFPVWQLISESINVSNKKLVRGLNSNGLPFSVFFFERLTSVILPFLNTLPIMLLAILLFGGLAVWHIPLALLALVCLLLWVSGVILIVSVIVTLKPDIGQFIAACMRLAFLATPIIWEPVRLGGYQHYLWLNPFFAPLEFTRYALSGILYMPNVVWLAPVYSIATFLLGLLIFSYNTSILKLRSVE